MHAALELILQIADVWRQEPVKVEDVTPVIGERRAFVPPWRIDEIKALQGHDDFFGDLCLPVERELSVWSRGV